MSQPAAAKRLILIVDDDQLLLEFLGEILRHAGYRRPASQFGRSGAASN